MVFSDFQYEIKTCLKKLRLSYSLKLVDMQTLVDFLREYMAGPLQRAINNNSYGTIFMLLARFDPPKQSAAQVLKLSRRSTSKLPRLDCRPALNNSKKYKKVSGVSHLGLVFQWEDGDKKYEREGKKERDGKIYFKNRV